MNSNNKISLNRNEDVGSNFEMVEGLENSYSRDKYENVEKGEYVPDTAPLIDNQQSTNGSGNSLENPKTDVSLTNNVLVFLGCFLALQVSYLTWGMMQELIMNTEFQPTPLNPTGRFPSATFCVFANRFCAILVSTCVVKMRFGSFATSAPLLAFTPCALSNTISSWAQYQALVYVSFSLQTVFKSMKVIPVMMMGFYLKGTTYKPIEMMEAVIITIGVIVFSLSKGGVDKDVSIVGEIIGFFLLSAYIVSDSFTSQWQSKLYADYGKIDSFQMMFGVNLSSIVITTIAMIFTGDIPVVIEFFRYNPSALYYNILTSITSTTGQMAIYFTIKRFGPVVFTIIMTIRQMMSIILSNYQFGHEMNLQAYIGLFIVFGIIAFSINRKYKDKSKSSAVK